jgi:hypothetical protein
MFSLGDMGFSDMQPDDVSAFTQDVPIDEAQQERVIDRL